MATFEIPKCSTRLRTVPRTQPQDEAELVDKLRSYQPIISEKNVWAFWDKGFDTMYPSYRCTVLNWMRKLDPSWTVRIVDLREGSPNNIYNFVESDWFPDCFNNKTMDGKHAPQHASDLIRLPLLYKYGGVWMDVGNMLHTNLDTLFWDHLADPATPYEMGVWIISGQIKKEWGSFGNYMVASRKGSEFIKNWHLCWKEVWNGRTNTNDFHKLPLMQEIGLADGMANWFSPEQVIAMSDYVAHMLVAERTKDLVDVETGWNGREYFEKKCFMVEGINNGILGALRTDQDGYKQAEFFATRLDDPDIEKRSAAEAFIVDMLENSHMYKVYHNSAGGVPALGDVIKKDGFRDVDHRPGTYGEMYRYGTVHWESDRAVERLTPQPISRPLIRATATQTASHVASGKRVKASDSTA